MQNAFLMSHPLGRVTGATLPHVVILIGKSLDFKPSITHQYVQTYCWILLETLLFTHKPQGQQAAALMKFLHTQSLFITA